MEIIMSGDKSSGKTETKNKTEDIFAGIRCIVCGNQDKSRFSKKYFKENCIVVECQNCSFHFIPPYFRQQIDYTAYKSEETGKQVAKADVWLKIQRNLLRYRLIQKYKKSGDVFDIGCGFGHFLLTGKQLGYNVTGVEMSKANLDYIRKNLDLEVQEKNFLDVKEDKKYDIMTLWDVLEHMDDADKIIAKVSVMLKPGGTIFIQVPQIDSFFARLLKDKWWEMGLDHVNYFSHKTIKQLFAQYGIEVVKIRSSLEIKNVFLYVILPRLKRRKKPLHTWTVSDRQQEFNKMTAKPMWYRKLLVFVHNIIYKILSFFRIGDEMIVVGVKKTGHFK